MRGRYLDFGPYTIDSEEHHLSRNGHEMRRPDNKRLMPLAVKILLRIIEAQPHIVRADNLQDLLDQQTSEDGRKVAFTKHISLIRRCFEPREFAKYIRNVPKREIRRRKAATSLLGKKPTEKTLPRKLCSLPLRETSSRLLRSG